MNTLILYHHAQGLTDGVREFATRLARPGLVVIAPDLYEGAKFESLEAGVAHAESIGFEQLLDRAAEPAAEITGPKIYAGFSLGALAAHKLAQTTEGAKGALLYAHADVPMDTFAPTWPDGVPLQIHVGSEDPFLDRSIVESFVSDVSGDNSAESFVYDDAGHLFCDPTIDGYNEAATDLLVARSCQLLDEVNPPTDS